MQQSNRNSNLGVLKGKNLNCLEANLKENAKQSEDLVSPSIFDIASATQVIEP